MAAERKSGERQTFDVVVSPEIEAGQIAELLVRIGNVGGTGCRACGLLGVDVRLTAEDPRILGENPQPSPWKSIVVR